MPRPPRSVELALDELIHGPDPDPPDPPADLGPIARDEFARIVEMLQRRGDLHYTAPALIRRYAELSEIAQTLHAALQRDPSNAENAEKLVRMHGTTSLALKGVAAELRLTPASRR